MAYKEIKLDSAGAKALGKAMGATNANIVKGGRKASTSKGTKRK